MDGGWEARVRERWGREDERRCVRRLGSEHGGGEDARVGRAGALSESEGTPAAFSETRADGFPEDSDAEFVARVSGGVESVGEHASVAANASASGPLGGKGDVGAYGVCMAAKRRDRT